MIEKSPSGKLMARTAYGELPDLITWLEALKQPCVRRAAVRKPELHPRPRHPLPSPHYAGFSFDKQCTRLNSAASAAAKAARAVRRLICWASVSAACWWLSVLRTTSALIDRHGAARAIVDLKSRYTVAHFDPGRTRVAVASGATAPGICIASTGCRKHPPTRCSTTHESARRGSACRST